MARKDPKQTADSSKPDFENNLAEFEADFLRFVTETDPGFDMSSLRHNPLAPITILNSSPPAELMHPTTKYELKLPIRLATPQTVRSDIVGDKVVLENGIKVQGSVYGISEVFIGPNCFIEGSVVGGHKVRIEEGSTIGGPVTGEVIELSGPITIDGPVVSRTDITVTGNLEAKALVAGESIFLMGAAGDAVKLAASYVLAYKGDIEAAVPVYLGTDRPANSDLQKFYYSQHNGKTSLMRARLSKFDHTPDSPQSTILTALTDSDLENLLSNGNKG